MVDPTEKDGNDEALVPNDFNLVVDDDIFDIVRTLPSGTASTDSAVEESSAWCRDHLMYMFMMGNAGILIPCLMG